MLADVAQGYGQRKPHSGKVWQGRQQQMALGGEAMAQGRAAKLLRPGARSRCGDGGGRYAQAA